MEKQMTDAERLADGERSGVISSDTIRVMNVIALLGDRFKTGARYDGNELRLFIREMERRGCRIPDKPLNTLPDAEQRALKTSFNAKAVGATMPERKQWTDAELTERIAEQRRIFNEMNEQQ